MNKIITTMLAIFILFGISTTEAFAAPAFDLSGVNAKSLLLLDVQSGKILVNKNDNIKIFPAGPTKLMTLLIALEKGGLNKTVTVGGEISTLGAASSKMGLKVGEKITVQSLLYGMILSSGNDAAQTLAISVGGSLSGFAALMNAKAKELGMNNTNFVNPHGIQDPNQYSTALDISKLVLDGLKNPVWRKIICTPAYDLPQTNLTAGVTLYTTNLLINPQPQYQQYNYQYAEGGSAGQTSSAGSCLIASAKKDNTEFLAIIYGDTSANGTERWSIAKNLFDYGFNSEQATNAQGNQNVSGGSSSDGNFVSAGSGGVAISADLHADMNSAATSGGQKSASANGTNSAGNKIATGSGSPLSVEPPAGKELFQTDTASPWWWLLLPGVVAVLIVVRVMTLDRRRRSRFKEKRKIHSYRIK